MGNFVENWYKMRQFYSPNWDKISRKMVEKLGSLGRRHIIGLNEIELKKWNSAILSPACF